MKRPLNKAQILRLTDQELDQFLDQCESIADTGVLYSLACDEQQAREERTGTSRAKVSVRQIVEDRLWS